MADWINLEDLETWQKRPNKYQLLYPDGHISTVIIFGNSESATLKIDDYSDHGNPTHWRPK